MARFETDSHYRKFCQDLGTVLARYPKTDVDLLVKQRDQLRGLISLETQFREALIRHPWGPKVYQDFVKFICDTRRNILAARPFYRERHDVFTRYISRALKARNDKALYRFRFNWSFVEWALRARKWNRGSRIVVLANGIRDARQALLEQNLPLAISQARMFFSNTPKAHLSYMDIVQIQCQGLLLAIDKFVPPNDTRMSERQSLARYRKFRAVAIGIMMRDRVNAYSETLVHFYPPDRMKIYRANKALRRQVDAEIDFDALADTVNIGLDEARFRTTPAEIQSLVAAGSAVSLDHPAHGAGGEEESADTVLDLQEAGEEQRPDVRVEAEDALQQMRIATRGLASLEQKLVRLKGVRF